MQERVWHPQGVVGGSDQAGVSEETDVDIAVEVDRDPTWLNLVGFGKESEFYLNTLS